MDVTYTAATLHVPTNAVYDYSSANIWEKFTNIVGDIETAGISEISLEDVKVSTDGGVISVSGLSNGENVSFYTLDGKVLGRATAVDGVVSQSAPSGMVIVKVGNSTMKVIVK